MQSTPLYHTAKGEAYVGNSLELLAELPDNCIDLVMTSPPLHFGTKRVTVMLRKRNTSSGSSHSARRYFGFSRRVGVLFLIWAEHIVPVFHHVPCTTSGYFWPSAMRSGFNWRRISIGLIRQSCHHQLNGSTNESFVQKILSTRCGGLVKQTFRKPMSGRC